MRSRRTGSEHQQVVSRRLAQLSDELAAARAGARSASSSLSPGGSADAVVAPAAGGEWWSDHTRVSGLPLHVVPEPVVLEPEPALAPSPPAPPVPVPGRHAARRGSGVPETLRGRVGLGPAHVAVVAVLVAVGALVTAVLVVRSDPAPPQVAGVSAEPVASVESSDPLVDLPAPAGAGSSAGAGPAHAAGGAATTVTVDVAGRVRRPGIAVLDPGSRVVDALEAAGGARPGVDLSSLNLARLLVDGEQILVGEQAAAAPGAVAPPAAAVPGSAPTTLVDLNTATPDELDTLPEVGPVTAAAIIAWRDEHGGFSAVEELIEVDGIGDATLARIAPHVTV